MKTVQFDLSKNCIYNTYSKDEYDRQMAVIRVTLTEVNNIYKELRKYKTTEMIVHNNSIGNTRLQ